MLQISLAFCVLQVLNDRIPFLLSSVKDFHQHMPSGQDSMVGSRVSFSNQLYVCREMNKVNKAECYILP